MCVCALHVFCCLALADWLLLLLRLLVLLACCSPAAALRAPVVADDGLWAAVGFGAGAAAAG